MCTYLGIELVGNLHRRHDVALEERVARRDAHFHAGQVHVRHNARLGTKGLGRILVSFDNKIVHHETVQIPNG